MKRKSGLKSDHIEILKRDYVWNAIKSSMDKAESKNPIDLLVVIKEELIKEEYELVKVFLNWANDSKLGITPGNYEWATSMFYEMSKGNKVNHIGL